MWFDGYTDGVLAIVGAFFTTYARLLAIVLGPPLALGIVWTVRRGLR